MITNPKTLILSVTLTGILSLFMTGCDKLPNKTGTSTTPPTTPPMTSNPSSSSTTMGTELDDSVITARVKSALLADDHVKGFDLGVETRKGEVYLSGLIDDQIQLDRAIQIASKTEGVKNVVNKLAIKK